MSSKSLDVAVAEFGQSVGLLVRRARAAADSSGLSWSESGVLKRLAQSGAATTAELARWQGMRPQSMRPIVATLEKMGMVARKPHPTDGRQVNLALTAKGAAAHKKAGEEKRTWLMEAFSRLSPEERETLFAAGKIIERLAEGEWR